MPTPFREGNGRSARICLDLMLNKALGLVVDWSQVEKEACLPVMERSPVRDGESKHVLKAARTDKTEEREINMKGLDHSDSYEGYTTYKAQEL